MQISPIADSCIMSRVPFPLLLTFPAIMICPLEGMSCTYVRTYVDCNAQVVRHPHRDGTEMLHLFDQILSGVGSKKCRTGKKRRQGQRRANGCVLQMTMKMPQHLNVTS